MRTEKLSKAQRLAYFSDLYENAKNSFAEAQEQFEKHLRQYRGSDEIDG